MLAKRFFHVCAGLLCLAIAYHLGAQSAGASRNQVVTQELVVTDGAGKHRATITAGYGGPCLTFWDPAGYPTVTLVGGSERDTKLNRGPYGGYLAIYDSAHKPRAGIGFRFEDGLDGWPKSDDEPGLALYGKDGKKIWTALP